MANISGNFISYDNSNTSVIAENVSLVGNISKNVDASFTINYIVVNRRPVSGQVFPRSV